MLILNQEKQRVVKFKDITELYVSCLDDDTTIYCYTNDDTEIALGFYKDKERCKEILKDIIYHYDTLEKTKLYAKNRYTLSIAESSFIYEMPEE